MQCLQWLTASIVPTRAKLQLPFFQWLAIASGKPGLGNRIQTITIRKRVPACTRTRSTHPGVPTISQIPTPARESSKVFRVPFALGHQPISIGTPTQTADAPTAAVTHFSDVAHAEFRCGKPFVVRISQSWKLHQCPY